MPCSLQLADGVQNVVGGQRDVLHAGAGIEIEILFDLRFLLAFGRLVDGELHVAVAVGHHLRHQRRVLGGDVLVVEVLVEREAHDARRRTSTHSSISCQPTLPTMWSMWSRPIGRATGSLLDGAKAGKKRAGVVVALDKCVDRVAIGANARQDDLSVLVGQDIRLGHADGAATGGFAPCATGVVDPERDRP